MILAIDMGNTNIVVGGIDENKTYFLERITTVANKTDFEFAVLLQGVLDITKRSPEEFDAAILSSVVPERNEMVVSAVKKIFNIDTMIVNPDMKMNIEIKIDNKYEAGADLIVDSVAAVEEYPLPLCVIDMGTATTLFIIDKDRNFIGGTIHPGIKLELQSLSSSTSLLPDVMFKTPEKIIGTNTVDCMLAGVYYGHAAMIDGSLKKMEEELGEPIHAIATGGMATNVVPLCQHQIALDDTLLLKGLFKLYEFNK